MLSTVALRRGAFARTDWDGWRDPVYQRAARARIPPMKGIELDDRTCEAWMNLGCGTERTWSSLRASAPP